MLEYYFSGTGSLSVTCVSNFQSFEDDAQPSYIPTVVFCLGYVMCLRFQCIFELCAHTYCEVHFFAVTDELFS